MFLGFLPMFFTAETQILRGIQLWTYMLFMPIHLSFKTICPRSSDLLVLVSTIAKLCFSLVRFMNHLTSLDKLAK